MSKSEFFNELQEKIDSKAKSLIFACVPLNLFLLLNGKSLVFEVFMKMCKFFTTKTTSWPPYTTFVPLFSPSYRNWMYIINNVTSSMSLFNHSQIIRARDMTFWHNVHHILCVICLVSHVRCRMSLIRSHLSRFVIYFLFRNCWS